MRFVPGLLFVSAVLSVAVLNPARQPTKTDVETIRRLCSNRAGLSGAELYRANAAVAAATNDIRTGELPDDVSECVAEALL